MLAIWFDPEVIRDAAPTGKRDRHQTCSETAIQIFLTIEDLCGEALRRAIGFVESLMLLVDLD